VALLAAEAALLAGLTLFLAFQALVQDVGNRRVAWSVVAYLAVLAAALILIVRGLLRRHPRSRAPGIALELLLVPLGLAILGGGNTAAGVAVLVAGLLGAALLLAPATGAALTPRARGAAS
jgi:hypothetical protein